MNNQYHKIKKQIFKYEKFGYGRFMQLNLIKNKLCRFKSWQMVSTIYIFKTLTYAKLYRNILNHDSKIKDVRY